MTVTTTNPVTTELVRTAFAAAADGMEAVLVRMAKSFLTYTVRDYAVALIDSEYRLLGQSVACPCFFGNLLGSCTALIARKYGPDVWQQGDVWAVNDSYVTGTHLPDVVVIKPIFSDGTLVGFAACLVNWLDIGSKSGSFFGDDSTEIFGEGIRITPIRVVEGGARCPDVIDLICGSGRYPDYNFGDLDAQIACVDVGHDMLLAAVARYGLADVLTARDALFAAADQFERAAVAAIPDGSYYAEGCIDDDGVSGQPAWVRMTVDVSGEHMTIDLSATDDARPGPVNCGEAQGVAAARWAYETIVSAGRPIDCGGFEPLTVIVREGSMLAATAPSPCSVFFRSLSLLVDLLGLALKDAIPRDVVAASYDDAILLITGVDDAAGLPFMHIESVVGGWGAWEGGDGQDALISNVQGDLKNVSIEESETKNPIRVTQYRLRADSGGAGKWRGGNGVVRDLLIESDNATLTVLFERSLTPVWGIRGGEDAMTSVVVINPGRPDERRLQLCSNEPLRRGDVVRALTGGGGGYGDPRERDGDLVRNEVRNNAVTVESARELYGLQMAP